MHWKLRTFPQLKVQKYRPEKEVNFVVDKFSRIVTSKKFAWINFCERLIKPIFALIYFRELIEILAKFLGFHAVL